MDRNENGLPRSTRSDTSPGRDCTGNVRSNPGGNMGTGDNMNGNGNNGMGNMNGGMSDYGCGPKSRDGECVDCLDTKPLAYSYTPIQRWQMLYTIDKALGRGTLFEELDKPLGVYGNE